MSMNYQVIFGSYGNPPGVRESGNQPIIVFSMLFCSFIRNFVCIIVSCFPIQLHPIRPLVFGVFLVFDTFTYSQNQHRMRLVTIY